MVFCRRVTFVLGLHRRPSGTSTSTVCPASRHRAHCPNQPHLLRHTPTYLTSELTHKPIASRTVNGRATEPVENSTAGAYLNYRLGTQSMVKDIITKLTPMACQRSTRLTHHKPRKRTCILWFVTLGFPPSSKEPLFDKLCAPLRLSARKSFGIGMRLEWIGLGTWTEHVYIVHSRTHQRIHNPEGLIIDRWSVIGNIPLSGLLVSKSMRFARLGLTSTPLPRPLSNLPAPPRICCASMLHCAVLSTPILPLVSSFFLIMVHPTSAASIPRCRWNRCIEVAQSVK